jgi:hypothetical protein
MTGGGRIVFWTQAPLSPGRPILIQRASRGSTARDKPEPTQEIENGFPLWPASSSSQRLWNWFRPLRRCICDLCCLCDERMMQNSNFYGVESRCAGRIQVGSGFPCLDRTNTSGLIAGMANVRPIYGLFPTSILRFMNLLISPAIFEMS